VDKAVRAGGGGWVAAGGDKGKLASDGASLDGASLDGVDGAGFDGARRSLDGASLDAVRPADPCGPFRTPSLLLVPGLLSLARSNASNS
jgi:hypothetical protein